MYADALAAIEAIEAVKVGDELGGALRLVAVATYLSTPPKRYKRNFTPERFGLTIP